MDTTLLLLLIGAFIVFTLIFKMVFTIYIEKGKYEKRVQKYLITINHEEEQTGKRKKIKRQTPLLKKFAKQLETKFHLKKHSVLLLQSGVKLSLGEFFIGRVATGFLCVVIGYVYDLHFLLLLLCSIVGFYFPMIYVKGKRKKRLQMCSVQLGNALGTMANALRAGFSFMQAMKMVAEEIEDPLGPEFLKALADINYGVPIETAFSSLIERLPDKELEIVLNTLLIQRTSGGNLALLFETMQETIIDRARVKDEVKTLTAQGKMSSVIITLLPVALALYLSLVNPEYFNRLFSHPLGWGMVIIGGFNIVIGWVFIKKIVHIEV